MNEKAKVRLVYVDQDYLDILRSVENKVSTKFQVVEWMKESLL